MKKLFLYSLFLFSWYTMHAMYPDGDPEAQDSSLSAIIITSAPASASSSSTESPSLVASLKDVNCPICIQSLTDKGHRYVVVDTHYPEKTLHQHCLLASLTTEAKQRHPLSREKLAESYLLMVQNVQTEVQELKDFHDQREGLLDKRQKELDQREKSLTDREAEFDNIKTILFNLAKRPCLLFCSGVSIGTIGTILAFVFS